jgi:anti-sigma factor RsiW
LSHLGDQLSALVDGELSGTELDRASAHLAGCGACRAELNSLRRLKHELRGLAEACDTDGITRRLLAMSSPPHPDDGHPDDQASGDLAAASLPSRYTREPGERHRGRYVLWSTVSVVVVGIGTAAFGMGGSGGPAEPQITPQVEVFDLQHAITSGDVLFAGSAAKSARVPAVATTP